MDECKRCHGTRQAHATWCPVEGCNCGWGGECPDCVPWVSNVRWPEPAPDVSAAPRIIPVAGAEGLGESQDSPG